MKLYLVQEILESYKDIPLIWELYICTQLEPSLETEKSIISSHETFEEASLACNAHMEKLLSNRRKALQDPNIPKILYMKALAGFPYQAQELLLEKKKT